MDRNYPRLDAWLAKAEAQEERTAAADVNGGYTWTVSFTSDAGDVAELIGTGGSLQANLTGTDKAVTVV